MRRRSKSVSTKVADREAVAIEPRIRPRSDCQTHLTNDQVDQLMDAYEDGLSMEDLASAFEGELTHSSGRVP
jgi:hypothetical protein